MIKKGACAGLINNPKLAAEIIQAVKEGVSKDQKIIIKNNSSFPRKRESRLRNEKEYYWIPGQAGNDKIKARNDNISSFPISVKTRIGFDEINTKDWIGFLLEQKLDAVTIHGRTAKEQSLVPAHWDEIGKAVKLRNQMKVKTLIIGNGDVKVRTDGLIKAEKYGIDGIAIGRGIFHNMWAFSQLSEIGSDPREGPTLSKLRFRLLQIHLNLFHQTWGNTKSFNLMKKYIKIYISGFPEALRLRQKLMASKNCQEAKKIITELSQTVSG